MPNCPQCGEEVGSDDRAGLCPQCLILGAFESSAGADESGAHTIDTATSEAGDDDFGRYRVHRSLGEGGMGTVYLAEQLEPIRRRVALKVVKLGMDTAQVLARFHNERQALAMMDHPNIAQIFDAGATTKGRPYFVMEYIEGAPITQYSDRKRMTTKERLALFLAVCQGVQHAHQKGVIHRDLKPSNVLVTEKDGAAIPKVIDFGIAKATDKWAVENTLLTQFGQIVGTPEYASPEQADTMTGEIDEASDVYSLGVLLYELLIGAVPFDTATLRNAGLAEMLRIIREDDAPSLPRKLTSMGADASGIAARRHTDPVSLRRLVDGDLNSITMKALEKTRERRYGSVSDLAADIHRHMEHRPVLASPPGEIYRACKFIRRHRPAALGLAAGLAFILLSAFTAWSLARRDSRPKLVSTEKRPIVLADFANTTGDSAFDGTPRQVLAGELRKKPDLSLLSDAHMTQALRLMVRAPDAKLTTELASEICERTWSAAVVDGSIVRLGNQYELSLRSRNCRTGDILDQEQKAVANKEGVLKALSDVASRLGSRASQSLAGAENEPRTPIEVTTPSLEAWRSFNAGWLAILRGNKNNEAASILQRAVDIDPKFAMAYALMGRAYDAIGEPELAEKHIGKAYELRGPVSDQENFFITFNYYRQVPRNLELARQTVDSWAQKYPRDLMPHSFFSGFVTSGQGDYERTVEEGLKAIEIDPNFAIAYYNAAFAYLYSNRPADAEALLRKASERKVEVREFSLLRYFIAFVRNDNASMEREVTQRRGRLQAQGWFEHQEALTAAYHGRLKEAARLSDSAVLLARQAGMGERVAEFEGARAVWSALFGIWEEAQRSAATALSHNRSRDADYGPAFALALLHATGQAHQITAGLEKRYPEDTSVQFSYLPALRGLEALNQRDPAKALEMTQAAVPYEFALPATAAVSQSFYGALYPVYVRGLAYFRMGRHGEAAAEFQKILDHPGLVLNDPIGPMARLQLARAFFASGDRVKSAAVYKDLLAIWKDADDGIAVVQEARAEFATRQ